MIPDLYNPNPTGADALVEGYYLRRGRSGRIDIPVRVWFGPPQDPDNRNLILDRAQRWQIEINGGLYGDPDQPVFIDRWPVEHYSDVWPLGEHSRITRDEYEYRVARADHAALYDPTDPFGVTGGRIDPMTCTLPFAD